MRELRDSKAYACSNYTDVGEVLFYDANDFGTQNRELTSEINRVSFGGIS